MNSRASTFLILLLASTHVYGFEWISHRAKIGSAIENSLAAIREVWKISPDAVEIDIRVSSDKVAYLFHNAEVQNIVLSELTYPEILRLVHKGEAPTLAGVLALGEPRGYYILDLKEYGREGISAVVNTVRESKFPPEKIAFQSRSPVILGLIQEKVSNAQYLLLHSLESTGLFGESPDAKTILSKIGALRIDGVSLKDRRFINREFVSTLKQKGLRVNIWTINNFDGVLYYRAIGADGVITDDVLGLRKRVQYFEHYRKH